MVARSNAISISPEVKAEAAAWIARLRADGRTVSDEYAFRHWISRDPSHAAAFEAVTMMWETVGMAGHVAVEPNRIGRRAALVGLGAVVVTTATFKVCRDAAAKTYRTEVGEQKHVVLADNTNVFLDADTCIRADFSDDQRTITLFRGRANFRVADLQPLVVNATQRCLVSPRSVFDLQSNGESVSLILIDGQAAIESSKPENRHAAITVSPVSASPPVLVKTGERLVMNSKTIVRLDTPNLEPLLAWHRGQAMFDNDTLANVVEEMNRYSDVKLEVGDPAVGGLRLSGVYRVGDNSAFAHSVVGLLHLSLKEDGNRILLSVAST